MPNGGAVANITRRPPKAGVTRRPANRKRRPSGTASCCSANWPKWRANTCVKALRSTSKAPCRPVNGRIRAAGSLHHRIVVNVGGTMQMLGGRQGGGAPAGQSAGGGAVGASLSSHRAVTSSAAASSSLARRRTALRQPATNRQWISTTISRSRIYLRRLCN